MVGASYRGRCERGGDQRSRKQFCWGHHSISPLDSKVNGVGFRFGNGEAIERSK
jgi:hypothetical protein